MTSYLLWIEMNEAKVFKMRVEGVQACVIHRREMKHHTSSDPENHKNCDRFFGELADAIGDADEILLTGPGLAKDHFVSYLNQHHYQSLASKIVGSRRLESMTDRQLLAEAASFFKVHDLFENPINA